MLYVIIYEDGWWCVWLTYNRLRELFCQVVPDNQLSDSSIFITAPVVESTHGDPIEAAHRFALIRISLYARSWAADNISKNIV